jgi:NADPH2:quinone reductase
VLVIGGSGSIGTYAVQLATHAGALVHAVCSGRNVSSLSRSARTGCSTTPSRTFVTSGERYDAVFDTVNRSSFTHCRRVLTPGGCYLPTTGLVNNVLALGTAITRGTRVRTGMSVRKHAALAELRELIRQGQLRIVIDRSYPLAEIVDAHRYVDSGHKVGNVVITVVDD